jgi:hypothetical protein
MGIRIAEERLRRDVREGIWPSLSMKNYLLMGDVDCGKFRTHTTFSEHIFEIKSLAFSAIFFKLLP